MVKTVSSTKAREEFADMISKVYYAGDDFIIEKQGKQVALVTRVKEDVGVLGQRKKGIDFLLGLADYKFKGGPKDLARKHDKYTWEE